MSDPTVSVIIPTYDRPQKLKRAISSVINQTYKDFEVIVVNDHPNRDIHHILPDEQYLHYIHHDENKGAPVARNNGILTSTGKYIAFLDDDDTWESEKLEYQIDRFEELDDDYGLVYTGRNIINEEYGNSKGEYIPAHEGWIHSTLLHKNVIPSETPLIRRKCFSNVGLYDPKFQSCQDWDLWIRISEKYKCAAVPKLLATTYEGHENRISTDIERKYHGKKMLFKKYKSDFESNPHALAKQLKRLGIFATQTGRDFEGVRYLISSYRHNPKDLIVLLYIIVGLSPPLVQEKLFKIRSKII